MKVEAQTFNVLSYLIDQRGRVVSRDELINAIWGHEYVSDSTLSSCIKLARKAVGDDGTRQAIIRTVHGRGYEFIGVVETSDSPNQPHQQLDGSDTRLAPTTQHLIGRDDLLHRIRAELHMSRLLTLVGPGGVGKTSLATRILEEIEARFADGICTVELVRVRRHESIIEAIATALSVHEQQDDTLDNAVIDVLRNREMLLLLDNCEHVIESVAMFAERVVRHAQKITLIATSREALAIPGEKVWPVEPLAIADLPEQNDIESSPAVALFVARASAADPQFQLTEHNRKAVIEICRRLDGMPLAIELAAARSRTLNVIDMVPRLDQRFSVFTGARRGADTRHKTLWDTVAWSYDLLDQEERTLFCELSIFAGPFALRDAASICDVDPEHDLVSLVARLTERSMIVVKPDQHAPRYELLDTLRAFGRAQLDEEYQQALSASHARHYTELANEAANSLTSTDEHAATTEIDSCFADLRAAFHANIAADDVASAASMVRGLCEYAMRSMRYEALTWAETPELQRAQNPTDLAAVLGVRAYAAWLRGEFERGVEHAKRAQAIESAQATLPGGISERVLANIFFVQGDTEAGLAMADRQLHLAEESGSHSRMAHACYMLAIANSSVGNQAVADEHVQRAFANAHASGNMTDLASAYVAAGFSGHQHADEALQNFTTGERIASEAGNRWMSTFARTEMCRLRVEQGEIESARPDLAEVIDIWFRAGEWSQQWLTLTACVIALTEIEENELACEIIGAMRGRTVLGALPATPGLRTRAFEARSTLQQRLGEEQYALLENRGSTQPVTNVVHALRKTFRDS